MAESLGSAVLTLSVDDTAYKAGLTAAKAQAERQGQAIGRTLGSSIATALAAAGGSALLANFFRQSIQAAIELETITKKLSNTLGQQGAGKALAFTKGLADELGLSFKTLAGTFGSFTAAASAAGVPLDVQRNLFASVSKAAQQLGLSNDELAGSLLALQQIASKGTVSMEELRGQLGERLPIAFAAAAKGLGVTQQELIKLVEGGRLASTQFFPAITKGLNELLSSSEGAPTAAQNLAKLGNAWDALQTSFGTDLLPSVTESVRTLTAVIEGLGRKQRADKLGFGTGGAGFLGQLSDQAIDAVENLKLVQQQFNLTDKQANSLFTDAVASTQRGRLVQSPAFLDAERISIVNQKVRELAQSYRDANPDRADELSREQAVIEKLRAAAVARADAETKIIGPSQARLRDLQAIQGLEGIALQQAKVQLATDKARAEQKKAIADYDKKLAGAGFDRDNSAVIEAAGKVEAAGNNLKVALLEGATALKTAADDAASRFIDASRQLLDARLKLGSLESNPRGLNQFLTPDEQFKSTREAIVRLGSDLEAGIASATKILNIPTGQANERFQGLRDIFSQAKQGVFASQAGFDRLQAFLNDVQARRDAISGVNSAQDAVNAINKELVGVNTSLRDQVAALVQKAWNVQVNVQGGQATAYGDVVNGALSAA